MRGRTESNHEWDAVHNNSAGDVLQLTAWATHSTGGVEEQLEKMQKVDG